MFTIYGGNTEFNQWDQGQRVVAPGLVAGDTVVFLNSSGMTLPMKAYTLDGEVVVDVPNKLLTMKMPVMVYINGHYETETSIPVMAQDKPEDYVFVDNDDWPSEVHEPTLNAAKAYTDEKVESGGSGGGSGITLPVVELSDSPYSLHDDGTRYLPDEDAAKLDAVADWQLPIVLIFDGLAVVMNARRGNSPRYSHYGLHEVYSPSTVNLNLDRSSNGSWKFYYISEE